MATIVSIDKVVFTPEEAKRWLAESSTEVQRPLNKQAVKRLAAAMQEGRFSNGATVKVIPYEGVRYLIDGRTRLNAIVQSGTTQVLPVSTMQASSYQDIIDTFIAENQGRTPGPKDIAMAMGLDRQTGLTAAQLGMAMAAVVHIKNDFNALNSGKLWGTATERANMVKMYSEAIGYYLEVVRSATRLMQNPLHWSAVIAVGIVTFQDSAQVIGFDRVCDWWTGLAQMQTGNGDSRAAAVEMLLTTVPPAGKPRPGAKSHPWEWISRYLAVCFNAWVKGESIAYAIPKVDKPIVIAGSRFNGKRLPLEIPLPIQEKNNEEYT